ncbi:hypothetical protein FQA39_LY11867 [Lamprigera yunnana]|nr:hypothetical protein FQA39_LY11867 [Lamprigera yunnana]
MLETTLQDDDLEGWIIADQDLLVVNLPTDDEITPAKHLIHTRSDKLLEKLSEVKQFTTNLSILLNIYEDTPN